MARASSVCWSARGGCWAPGPQKRGPLVKLSLCAHWQGCEAWRGLGRALECMRGCWALDPRKRASPHILNLCAQWLGRDGMARALRRVLGCKKKSMCSKPLKTRATSYCALVCTLAGTSRHGGCLGNALGCKGLVHL